MARQRGVTLVLLLLVVVVGAVSVFLAVRDPAAAHRARRLADAARALAEARTTVLARALVDGNRPGSLPCAAPDEGGSGTFNGNDCDADAGRFPHRTLETRPLRDASRALLWYALDPALRDRATQEPINPQAKQGGLSVDGAGHYVAVIVAPGEALPGQSRAGGLRADFLEGGNESGTAFVGCTGVGGCNDVVRGISVDTLFDDVQRRVVAAVAAALVVAWETSAADPDQRHLPYAAGFGTSECAAGRELGRIATADADNDCNGAVVDADDLPQWLHDNDWLELVVYHVDPECTEASRDCGAATMTLDGAGGVPAIVAAAGRALAAQARPGADVADYLDAAENADGDADYVERPLGSDDNDVVRRITLP